MTAGACFCEDKKQVVTSEVSWDLTNKFKGLQGMPLLWNFSSVWKLSNGSTFNMKMILAKQWMCSSKFESPVADGVKLVYENNFDVKCALSCPKDFKMKNGMTIELKL